MDTERSLDKSTKPDSLPETPVLLPVAFVNFKLDEPDSIYSDKARNSSLSYVQILNGEVTTIENKLKYELEVSGIYGSDELTNDLVTGCSRSNSRLYGKTPNGAGVHISYPGMIKLSDATLKVISGQTSESDFNDSYMICYPHFAFDDSVEEKFRWASNESLIGKGRITRDTTGYIYIQYVVYVVR
ncbi:Piso0_005310 [Millerozyma farinosa CBS 7064]|uniref:Piso0_005310 protein n=1 Tax=Pichia sorbitophila (strain ATCC MYA-4447 / BCRC 22081 / CBS 7064 / NBRC 10061 / NRRL Y-12695) TaxID=559304 RepID=G8Y4S1_PICSO|nr:Piso0_005310 [Millerozyma farinosa CBS 7064]